MVLIHFRQIMSQTEAKAARQELNPLLNGVAELPSNFIEDKVIYCNTTLRAKFDKLFEEQHAIISKSDLRKPI